jgi:CRISPR-associated protein Csb1
MTEPTAKEESHAVTTVTIDILDTWATDPNGPIALHLKQKLVPVEGEAGVIFPPTYADIGYNIDTLSDGRKVAMIDSVGSQANRLEPIFKAFPDHQAMNPLASLVPQIQIVLHPEESTDTRAKGEQAKTPKEGGEEEGGEGKPHQEKRSILDLAHRSADAVVQSCPTLIPEIAKAFRTLRQTGNAGPLCALAPTSLVFGVWDSRGDTGEKRPRLVRAVIRAWDVETLHSAAQFTSIWKALSEQQQEELKKEAKAKKRDLSTQGLADAPATFRKVGTNAARYMQEFRDGAPNPERRVLGGVLPKGPIEREVTVNLVALRGLRGGKSEETTCIQKYLLALSLLAATADIDLFLREGCHLRYAGEDHWHAVPRRGEPRLVDLTSSDARTLVKTYAFAARAEFEKKWPGPKTLEHNFDIKAAKKLLAKKEEENPVEG